MEKTELFSYCKNGKWGLVDQDKNVIVPLVFEEEIYFYFDYAAAKLDGKYGFIDRNGNTIIAYMYDDAGHFRYGLGDVCLNEKWGCVDKMGKLVIPCEFSHPLSFGSEDDIQAVNESGVSLSIYLDGDTSGGKWGLINTKSEMVISYKYDNISSFDSDLLTVELDGKWGLINTSDQLILPFNYDFLIVIVNNFIKVRLGTKWGFLDFNGDVVIPIIYENELRYSPEYMAAKLNGKHGFIDLTGKTIIPFIYDDALSFDSGVGSVCLNGKWGCVDKFGNLIIPCKHLLPLNFYCDYIVVEVNSGGKLNRKKDKIIGGKWGFINIKGELVTPSQFDEILNLPKSLNQVKINDKYGLFDIKGNEVLACKFSKTNLDFLFENFVHLRNN